MELLPLEESFETAVHDDVSEYETVVCETVRAKVLYSNPSNSGEDLSISKGINFEYVSNNCLNM